MARLEYLLLFGGNTGDPPATFDQVTIELQQFGAIEAVSRDHWTEPWGMDDDAPVFLNRALLLGSQMAPQQLMKELLTLEERHGRVREMNASPRSRPIDIDILMAGNMILKEPELQLPHPRMHSRTFALAPAADVAPGLVHPITGRTILHMLNDLLRQGS